jgi:hypothetical protein
MRKQGMSNNRSTAFSNSNKPAPTNLDGDMEYLDIPAFLRRKEEAETS